MRRAALLLCLLVSHRLRRGGARPLPGQALRAPTATPTSRSSSPTPARCAATSAEHALPAKLLLRARELARDLGKQAELGLELPPGPGSTLRYSASLESGHVAFSDRSTGQPKTFFQLAQFTKDVAEDVCGISR